MYFLVRWLCIGIVRSFFKEVAVLHPERIPLYGPAIFVGNHNNQFMDASMLVANIPRQVHFLVALKSMKRKVIGFLSRLAGCIPVDRQDDRAVKGQGAARISHHFTEEDHSCPQPPHHHHHARPKAAEGAAGQRGDTTARDSRGRVGESLPQDETSSKFGEARGGLKTPGGSVDDPKDRRKSAEDQRGTANGDGPNGEGHSSGTPNPEEGVVTHGAVPRHLEVPAGDGAHDARTPVSRSPTPVAYTLGKNAAVDRNLRSELIRAFASRAPSPAVPRSEGPPYGKSASAPLALFGPPHLVSILGHHTRFLAEVRPGYKIRLDGKDYLVLRVLSDTHLVVRPPQDAPRRLGSSPLPTPAGTWSSVAPRVAPSVRPPGHWDASPLSPQGTTSGERDRAEEAREGAPSSTRSGAVAASSGRKASEKEESESEAEMQRRSDSFSSQSSSSSTSSGPGGQGVFSRSDSMARFGMNAGDGQTNAKAGGVGGEPGDQENLPPEAGLNRDSSAASLQGGAALATRTASARDVGAVSDRDQALPTEVKRPVTPSPASFGEVTAEGLRRRVHQAALAGKEGSLHESGGRESRADSRGAAAGEGSHEGQGSGHRHADDEEPHLAANVKTEREKRLAAASYKEYKILPKVDQREVYEAVSHSLVDGDCIGIFPEGGSHDRTTLLPLKPGVAIMAIQGVAAGADVMIVPVGLVYHNPHKTQSRATIHIGEPIPISRESVIEYQQDRRAATARILTDVEHGLRSCIITAQDHETMTLIHLCCSLYPPERLRLSPEKLFNLNQLLSKLFWRCADAPELSRLRQDLEQYQGALQRAGIPDHDVWMLKQSTAGASLCFAEKLIALLFSIILGVPLLPLWGPLRVVAYFLAERHRAQALAASSVKVKGMDVVASYKVIVLLVCVPLFNLLYGAIFGLVLRRTLTETLVAMLLCVCLLPIAYYFSMRRAERILPLIRQMRTLVIVLVGKVNIWRENERELITQRMNLQFSVRETLLTLGPQTSPAFMDELYSILPKAVLVADIKRLIRKKEDFAPLQMKSLMNNAEEIL
ncbi:putative glycerol-3-phosphate acyltransferase [Neospora caninum Liverpool]|uniref:Glycerol-3-phosphate acyltransferase, putative n=1 Tax=Neospora caninum (strain Liverpool) TaxID=572307 RepID=F0VHL6_NEOCL|nr:putative glycerol-3-phosphate acyltransferase [Neospora caninum Liverpool]CBZ53210.1 putative glycerol-3-phosphate acyltransferase [Neospora caninum Liverpool]CEL67200.1 TPA: glycerol-3-phosphate acyltransferase, putative [Neospora caninum Liverpool]|eukprot:XP_003883242.1 putative glycerol-3-phosphate acyltransferase [Neospora caninum Liverpool]